MEILSLSELVQDELVSIGLDDISVYVLNNDYFTIAVKEALASSPKTDTTTWFIEWFYRKSVAIDELPTRSALLKGNQWVLPENDEPIWYRIPRPIVSDQTAVLVSQPLLVNGEKKGILLLEKTSDQLVALTNSAFNRLFFF